MMKLVQSSESFLIIIILHKIAWQALLWTAFPTGSFCTASEKLLSSKLAGCSIHKSSHHRWGLLCIMKAVGIRTRGLLETCWEHVSTRGGLRRSAGRIPHSPPRRSKVRSAQNPAALLQLPDSSSALPCSSSPNQTRLRLGFDSVFALSSKLAGCSILGRLF